MAPKIKRRKQKREWESERSLRDAKTFYGAQYLMTGCRTYPPKKIVIVSIPDLHCLGKDRLNHQNIRFEFSHRYAPFFTGKGCNYGRCYPEAFDALGTIKSASKPPRGPLVCSFAIKNAIRGQPLRPSGGRCRFCVVDVDFVLCNSSASTRNVWPEVKGCVSRRNKYDLRGTSLSVIRFRRFRMKY